MAASPVDSSSHLLLFSRWSGLGSGVTALSLCPAALTFTLDVTASGSSVNEVGRSRRTARSCRTNRTADETTNQSAEG